MTQSYARFTVSLIKPMKLNSFLFTLLLCLSSAVTLYAQSVPGVLKGKVTKDNEAAFDARVTVKRGDNFVNGALTDENGEFRIENLDPGPYNVEIKYEDTTVVRPVSIKQGTTEEIKVEVGKEGSGGITLTKVDIVAERKLIEKDNVVRRDQKDLADVRKVASRSIADVVSVGVAGVVQTRDGGFNIRGGRGDQTATFVDGMRVIGSAGLPQVGLKSVSLVTGGTPPWYGDATSGIIEIETADPTPKMIISGEALTSQFLDPYGYNLGALSVSGPIWKSRTPNPFSEKDTITLTRLGFFLAGEVQYQKDRDPSGIDLWKMKDDVRERINKNPIRAVQQGDDVTFYSETDFLRKDAFEKTKTKENNNQFSVSINGRLDFRVNKSLVAPAYLKLGGSYRINNQNEWSLTNMLYANDNNSHREEKDLRLFARFSQSFVPADPSKSILKNLSYNLQVDYSRRNAALFNPNWNDDVFKYGYIGQFGKSAVINRGNLRQTRQQAEIFELIAPSDPRHDKRLTSDAYWQTAGFRDTAFNFNGSKTANPVAARYNEVIYDYYKRNPQFAPFDLFYTGFRQDLRQNIFDIFQLQRNNGILNGTEPNSNYSLFNMPGNVYNGYAKFQNEMFRVTGYATFVLGPKAKPKTEEDKASLELVKANKGLHTIRVGFEFDQRTERSYSLGATGLWTLARNLANKHIQDLDRNPLNATPIFSTGENGQRYFQDTVLLNREFNASQQSNFSKNLRRSLGLDPNGIDYINVDYLTPDQLNINMFDATELFAGGKPVVSYYGYDYQGGLMGSRASDQSFFTDTRNRPINAFSPTYVAGYIQDKFEMDRIYFTLGLRVDRLDLNQKVLKDRYVMVPTWTAIEAANGGGYKLPSSVGEDWVPYVSGLPQAEPGKEVPNNLTQDRILGYRNGDRWYDKNGAPIDPTLLRVGGRVLPYYKRDSISFDAFKDYEPQVNFMPRISFSFDISDRANFFAHYDILTQRPTEAFRLQYTDFIFIQQNATTAIDNPALKPSRTVDYEVGYQQMLDEEGSAAISISAFYREMRDMIQFFRFQNAYPITYDSYENIDFGTVKGFTFDFKTRSNRLVSFRAAYTLQFAQGTGSNANSGRGAVSGLVGFSVIRTLIPFDFDQRHTVTGNIVFSFDEAQERRGPKLKIGEKIYYPLKNSSASFTFRAGTGTPYTRNAIPNQADVQFGVNSTTVTQGNLNGSRYPFNYNLDLRIDKSFNFTMGGTKKQENEVSVREGGRDVNLNFYLVFLNLLNVQNILQVYSYSGQPDRSGYLESEQGKQLVQRQVDSQAFVDQYRIRENNPGFYNLPRRIRLGLIFTF